MAKFSKAKADELVNGLEKFFKISFEKRKKLLSDNCDSSRMCEQGKFMFELFCDETNHDFLQHCNLKNEKVCLGCRYSFLTFLRNL